MGHYCRICGRTRANEKFSGKGHKNHVCKDCSRKSGKSKKSTFNKNAIATKVIASSDDVPNQSDDMFLDDNDEELPF